MEAMSGNARAFALEAHGAQRYGDQPYACHLDAVALLAAPYGEEAVTVAYLHDTVEDTEATLVDIADRFGPLVAACVGLLTDEPGATRKERKASTYAKLARVSGPMELALLVKTADRLANVRACIADRNERLWAVYQSEHQAFRGAAYRAGLCDVLWAELDPLLSHGLPDAATASIQQGFANNGFALVPQVLGPDMCATVLAQMGNLPDGAAGTRCLLSQPWCAALAGQLRQHDALAHLIPRDAVAVQCTAFEKSASRNWLVPVHQDLSIPVAERVTHPALAGWSEKEGQLFVQPPAELLAQLVAVRVHLDACTPQDGPLQVVPGTHVRGRITPEAAVALRHGGKVVDCCAAAGDAWVLRPLLLHASSRATGASRRRVLHFLFGPPSLPHGLRWRCAV